MICGLSRSAAACSAATSPSARKALSFLRKAMLFRFSSCSMNEWPLSQYVAWNGKNDATRMTNRPEDLIADIEVVMGETAGLMRQDAVVGILRGILRHADPERPALFHALEDEVDSTGILFHHPSQRGQHVIFLTNTSSRPLNRDLMVAGESLHPVLVSVGSLAENFLAHHRNAEDLAHEMNHLFGPGQTAEVAVDDNAVEAVIYKNEQAAKQLCESLHRSSPSVLVSTTRSSDRRPVVSKFQI